MVKRFLLEQHLSPSVLRLLMDLLTFVMHHSYLSFKNTVYHQIDGTAMGTAVAPTYANIVVYMLERSVIEELGESIYIYRRFLDDIFAYLSPTCASRFQKRMNELHPKLIFEFQSTIPKSHSSISPSLRDNDLRLMVASTFQYIKRRWICISTFHSSHITQKQRSEVSSHRAHAIH